MRGTRLIFAANHEVNTVATSGDLTADGSMAFDHNQFPGFWGTAQDVVEKAFALTINATAIGDITLRSRPGLFNRNR